MLLQLQEYVLWRLRDAPGQRTLSAFQQQPGTAFSALDKPGSITAALPPSPYKKYAAAAAAATSAQAQPAPSSYPHQMQQHAHPGTNVGTSIANDDAKGRPKSADFAQVSSMEQNRLPALGEASAGQLHRHQTPGQTDSGGLSLPIAAPAAAETMPPAEPTHKQGNTAGAASNPATAINSADYRAAHEVAAAARAACDLLRGPPKSSRDDPHFMDSYYRSSRLSFIGRWKARIEALTAAMAANAPLPQVAHQPLALMQAFKQSKGTALKIINGTGMIWSILG